ncbi:thermonuclease family protein [bacterium]|nr:thermonuclease family protein [bacterium]
MRKHFAKLAILLVLLFNSNVIANDIKDNVETAEVKYVVDGDTIHLYTGGEIIKTRLYGIDCMETSPIHRTYHQAYNAGITIEEVINQGRLATKILKKIIKENNNKVYFKTMGVDRYGRLIAIIYDKNHKSINDMLLKTPYCIPYEYNKNFTNASKNVII